MATTQEQVNEGQNYSYTLNTDLDTGEAEIKAFIAPLSDPEGNTEEVGSTTGAEANTDIPVPLNLQDSGLEPGEPHYLEIWLEPDTSEAALLIPNEGDTFVLIAQDRNQVT